ncbi:MinD/ParA family ATP-binding protein [Nocardia cyriacigeorgica]|uniref:MinD/ParA family ATP-binding protein n=1 Tax=Nocardia cyriacigeorgica TaxID=135487 RepID=UPI0028114522|nr:AAA family ATPase [Nocardia cyriacigeorgica]
MSRSNDGLPMLPPWLSDSEVTQVGQQTDYHAPPVENLPHDDLISDTPAPKRRFKRPAPEADRSDAPGPRKEKKRKPWRRDKNEDQRVADQFDDEADTGHRAPPPNDQWSNPPHQTDRPGDQWSNPPVNTDGPGDRWQSAPMPEQRPAPSDYGPSDRPQGPNTRPADPYQSAPAQQQPYHPAPDNSWQQGPAQTGERPAPHLPTRTPSEPPADFRPLGPRPPQVPADQAPVSTEATVHLGPRPDLPPPPPPQAPVAPPQAATTPPRTPVTPPQPPVAPPQPVAPQQPERPSPVDGRTPAPHPNAGSSAGQPVPPPVEPSIGVSAESAAASRRETSMPDQQTPRPRPDFDAGQPEPQAPPIDSAAQAPHADQGPATGGSHNATEPPSWLEGPRGDSEPSVDGGTTPEAPQAVETARPSNATDSRPVDSVSAPTASDSATTTDAPPAWLGPTTAPEQPTAQRPLQRLPDLPAAPGESEARASAHPADSAPAEPADEPRAAVPADESAPALRPNNAPADVHTSDPQLATSSSASSAHSGPGTPTLEPDTQHAKAGPAENVGDRNRAEAGRLDPADDAVSVTRGRHRLAAEVESQPANASLEEQAPRSVATGADLPPQPREQQAGQQFSATDGSVPPHSDTPDRARGPHAGPAAHTSGFDHRLPHPPAPVTGTEPAPNPAPKQQRRTAQSGADAALRAALAAQPLRAFDGAGREANPAPEQWQSGQTPADQQGRPAQPPAPQWQSPVAPGPDTPPQPGPRNQAGMHAPSAQMPGPHGYAQAPGPQQHPDASHPTPPHSAPQHHSMPQHPVAPQHSGPPQQQWRGPADQGPPQEQWQGGQGQQPGMSPSLDNVPIRGRATKKAAGSGWRKAVHHVSGGAINPGMSAEERRLQELVARIRQPVRGDYRIAVLSLKGGVGKTTTTMGIGSTFASIRGDRVIAVDANPDFGTLSQRVPLQTRSTVRDLLLDSSIQRYSDVRRHTSQATSRLEVLASERDPAASEAFNEDEYRSVARILQRFYNIILTDCGTGLMHSAMAGVLELAHSLVLISSPAIDGARSAAATLDWLSLHGHDHLVRNAVVVINSPRSGSPNVGIQQLREYFLSRCRAVHIIPFDPHMSEGAEIDLHRLHKQTKRAYVELAATVADDFATDHRRYRG